MIQATKLASLAVIGLAMIEFTAVPSLNAAVTAKAPHAKCATARARSTQDRPIQANKGLASVYADKFIGRKTASGQKFCQSKLTAAHRTLPMGTKVRVTNVRNKKTVVVRINDRGPHIRGRLIDLSGEAARHLGMGKRGNALVTLEVLGRSADKS